MEVLAEYLETVQWKKQFSDLKPTGTDQLGDALPVRGDQFDASEVQAALKSLSTGKAVGNDGIPSDLSKLLLKSKDAVQELLKLCQVCWSEKELPETWRTAKVVMLYKATIVYPKIIGRFRFYQSGTKFWHG